VYSRDKLSDIVNEIDPDLFGLFSIAPETYSHTLSESWSLGLPVLATNLGAVAERVRRHGGGILLDVDDLDGIVELLVSKGRSAVEGQDLGLPAVSLSSVRALERMTQDYLHLYDEIGSGVPRRGSVGFVPSTGSGSSYLRTRSRVNRLAGAAEFDFREIKIDSFVSGSDGRDFDTLLLQRDALVGVDVAAFLQRARESQTRIVAELDDDLLSDSSIGRVPETIVKSCRELVACADAVVVSTEALREIVLHFTQAPVLVSLNLLDDVSWQGADTDGAPAEGRVRWVYWGTNTHTTDLELVKNAFPSVTSDGRRIELDVIGVSDIDQPWFTRLVVPPGQRSYVSFAQWLRKTAENRQWAGGIAPLEDELFNSSKSDLKVLEYSLLGLPSLASDVPAYRGLARFGQTLVPSEPDAWASAVRQASTEISSLHSQPLVDYARDERTLANRRELMKWANFVLGDNSTR
jgi:glycosyltransferase involved in cell wall biosynthesis